MGNTQRGRGTLPPWIGGLVLLVTVLCVSAIPGHTWRGGGHGGGGHRGGGHGFHGGHRGGGHGFHGGHKFYGRHGWGGVGISVGVGPYWGAYGYPYGYAYGYPYDYLYGYSYGYPYTYAPQIAVQPAPPVAMQPPSSPPVWYYCDNPEGYYPYVQQCPGGWRTVAPNPQ
jgi:hypothetical protein